MAEAVCRVSVVVPTYNRPAQLERCLAALLAQDIEPAAYEVIVADDAACDATRRQVCCHAERVRASGHWLRYQPVTGRHGPAAARNAGWRAAEGAIIAFTDDDCLPAPGWLRAGLAACLNGAEGASGRVVVPLPRRPTDYERDAANLVRSSFVTANCFYRRDTLAAVGGFDERFTAAWREDSDLYFTLLRRHARLVEAPDAVVVHPVRPARWGVSLSQQRKSLFNALLYKKHPALYRRYIQAAPPWHYYRMMGALLLALGGLLRGDRRCTRAAALLWAGMVARFCLLRLRGASHSPRHVAEMAVTSVLIPPLSIYWRIRGALAFHVFFFIA